MAREELSVQSIPSAGLVNATYTAAVSDGHKVSADDSRRTTLRAVNAGGAQRTVTVQTPGSEDGLAVDDREVDIPAGQDALIPLGRDYYAQSDGYVYIDYDATTSLTVAALKLDS